MFNFGAFLAIAMGVLGLVTMQDALTPVGWIQVVTGIGGGTIALAINNFSLAKDWFISSTKKAESKIEVQQENLVLLPREIEFTDNAALIHLRNRLRRAKSEEGLQLCSKLATIVFDLDDEVPDVKE